MQYIQLAWRNIWRNPRRTIVILLAVLIGVWSMVFLGALMRGITVGMVKNGIATLTGHLQIHYPGFHDDPSIENRITNVVQLTETLSHVLPDKNRWALRVRVPAVAANARHSAGVTLVGVDPVTEARVSFIGGAIKMGKYLSDEDDHSIVVGEALLKTFNTKLGHKLVLMSQSVDGEMVSKAFRIVGSFRAELMSTEKQYIFVTRRSAQKMLKLRKDITEVSILLPDVNDVHRVREALLNALPNSEYEVLTWTELLPLLTAYLKLYDQFILIWYLVVFVAMAFGIVNTTLMAVLERIREFGLLQVFGMRPFFILGEVLVESFILLIIGIAAGNALALACIFGLGKSGLDLSAFAAGVEFAGMSRIIYPDLQLQDWVMANLVVLVLGLVVSCYPAFKASRYRPVEALAYA